MVHLSKKPGCFVRSSKVDKAIENCSVFGLLPRRTSTRGYGLLVLISSCRFCLLFRPRLGSIWPAYVHAIVLKPNTAIALAIIFQLQSNFHISTLHRTMRALKRLL